MSLDDDLLALAATQHGAFTPAQARLLGASRKWAPGKVARGWLLQPTSRVLVVAGSPSTTYRDAMVALLDAGPGSVLSHTSAVGLWGVPGYQIVPGHVLRSRAGPQRRDVLATVHASRRIPEGHVVLLNGIPVTTPTRTCFDAAAILSPLRVARVVDRLWSRRLTSGRLLRAMRKELSRQGRTGLGTIDEVLAERGTDYVPPANGLEARFHQIIAEDGQRPLARQVDIHDDEEGWLGRIDAWDHEVGVVVEVDGDEFHTALTDRAVDEARRSRYTAQGLIVVVCAASEVWHQRQVVVDRVRAARADGRHRRLAA